MTTIQTIVAIVVGGVIYFLPAIIGASKRNEMAIFWLNLLLGWSLIGWVVALVWAVSKDTPVPIAASQVIVPIPTPTPLDLAERTAQLKQLRDQGLLTQEEFMQQISRLA
ncbi:superinfection immunity protein [Hymenobacter caeli]|uniref:Superinfection immunity protein n=1 Tax=Hymenobacter caeli TaxID=2735894 RepID=A0ABX2FKF5_9BACT|nr:superinfection immunity protein [Hymenobacter caeli]NRT17603.1 hypothetical protein [Hymenobacter caeli]